ncbi:MAG: nitrous oxide reductase accessory protein NosL [bacterium]
MKGTMIKISMRKPKHKKKKNHTQRRRDAKATPRFFFAKSLRLSVFAWYVFLFGCSSSEIKPVDIYPEDMCSHCRMAISDQRFASEIITVSDEVFKFDDLGCMESFKAKSSNLKIAATFVKDYETKNWIPYEHSTIVQTSIRTPMSSGKVALTDSVKAKEFLNKLPGNEK